MDNLEPRKKERDRWCAEGAKSFMRMKVDWFNGDDFDSRLHLSFVEHSGSPKYSQLKVIEIGVPVVKAGSDGKGNSDVTALGLAAMLKSGLLIRKLQRSAEAARTQGKKYADDVWCCIGGTTAERSKTGKPEFRSVSIGPSQKEGMAVLKAMSCEGESGPNGGVQPVKGATRTTIMVPVAFDYLMALGSAIEDEWTAYLSAKKTVERLNKQMPNSAPAPTTNPTPTPAPALTPDPEKKGLVIFFDTMINIRRVANFSNAEKVAKDYFALLHEEGYSREVKESWQDLLKILREKKDANWSVPFVKMKGDGNANAGQNKLCVMVFADVFTYV